ncbi:hypothetical protein EVJ58_g2673 [Rhodofomes roseus]|uniref:DEAD/DEAH-box helicase domain-containing protein n=1 Tax=Rhodofomes roseus TaxID=34475 RepID=A0A4Y9YTG0_9APHY|nr:hypothetical protein EVJ58_g2673 [Rhodofomes roseus]
MHLGLDSVIIAPTGSGKTLPMISPLLLPENKDKMVAIISPYKDLEFGQASRFTQLRLRAAVVNGDTWSVPLRRELEALKYQVALMSPEMPLERLTGVL